MSEWHGLLIGWATAPVGEVVEIVRGVTFPSTVKKFRPQPNHIACLRTANVQHEVEWDDLWFIPEDYVKREEQVVEPSDILISTANSYELVGKVARVKHMPCNATLGAFISLLRGPDLLDADYLYYFLSSTETQTRIREMASTTTNISNVSTKKLKTLNLKIPPVAEQRRMVAAIEEQLSRLDAGVAGLERVRTTLKRYRTAVLKAAVEGRLTEDWREENPNVEPASELLERVLKERREQWEKDQLAAYEKKGKKPPKNWRSKYREPAGPKTEDLFELPEGWCWVSVEQLADVGTGATPLRNRTDYYENGTIPWVTSGALNHLLIVGAVEYITEKALLETNAKIFPSGSLLIAMYGEGKTRGKVAELAIDASTNQACAALVFNSASKLCQPYVKQFMLSRYFDIRRLSAGGVQPNLNLSIVRRTVVALPPLEEQDQIVAEIERRLSILQEVEAEVEANLKRAARLRQAILKQAFEGKLVPQDPTDEPASELLARIRTERERSAPPKRRPGKRPAQGSAIAPQPSLFPDTGT